jgi:putative ABC transport system permease protein
MNTIFKLAFRNVGRNRRRSVLALISVSLSLMMIVCMQGWISGIMSSTVKNYTKNETGNIRIANVKFEEKSKFFPVTDNIDNPELITDRIMKDSLIAPEVSLVSQRIMFSVLMTNDGKNVAAMAFAGDPEKEKQLLMLQESILPGGRYISGPHEAIIGKTLAKRLGFKVGDTIKIVTTGSDYALRMKKSLIVGIFNSGIGMLDENVFQIPIETARQLIGMKGQAQQIIVMLKDWHKSDLVAAQINKLLHNPSLAVTSWTKIGDYYQLVKSGEAIYQFIYLVVAFLGAFIISNIMMMVVMERRKEIGILKSMGMTKREILVLFLTEGMILGLTGSIIGTAAGWILVSIFGHTGVDIASIMQSMKFPIDNIIHPAIGIAGIIGSLILGTLVASLVSLLPARQAATMNAVDAIKSI